MDRLNINTLVEQLRSGDRKALARAITLIESSHKTHQNNARMLLDKIWSQKITSMRIAVSGSPGAGKSSLIEKLGLGFIKAGHQVAVLAVDPSSPISGGSILGDKTRMMELGQHAQAFIRPSPSGSASGGTTDQTRSTIVLCETAGYDVIFLETVGVGQAEYAAANMVDLFLYVQIPNSGDELQGVKKGILELADMIVVNKADGDFKNAASIAQAELKRALSLNAERSGTPVLLASALTGDGIASIIDGIAKKCADQSQDLKKKRREQAKIWLEEESSKIILQRLSENKKFASLMRKAQKEITANKSSVPSLAHEIASSMFDAVPVRRKVKRR